MKKVYSLFISFMILLLVGCDSDGGGSLTAPTTPPSDWDIV